MPAVGPSPLPVAAASANVLRGIAGSPGVAMGPAVVLGAQRTAVPHRTISDGDEDGEVRRFRDAVRRAQDEMRAVARRLEGKAGRGETSILEAYVMMLGDETIAEGVERLVRGDHRSAEWAIEGVVRELEARMAGASDAYLVERRHDVAFVGERLLRAIAGPSDVPSLPPLVEPSVIVAHDLSPADMAAMVREPVVGIVTEVGTRTSHTAIMARALEIPAVVGVPDALGAIGRADALVVDGLRGEVVIAPGPEVVAEARRRAERHIALARHLREDRERPAATADGARIRLEANIELPAEAVLAIDHGAEGIGLYRTEFLYVDRAQPPDEEEQFDVYRRVVETMSPRPVTLRTFDIGGDKFVSTFQTPEEMNPALGLRAVRLALSRPEVFLPHLRAMVRASAHGPVRILVPMVAGLRELREVRRLIDRAKREVQASGQPVAQRIPVGIMVEVPAAAVLCDVLARESDFFSLGTNDLIQYSLAIDRTSRSLAYLASPFDPAILRLIAHVVSASRRHARPLSICGAMASDPLAAILLVGLGLRDLSMEAAAVPEIKETLRRVSLPEAVAVAEEALRQDTAEDAEHAVAAAFAPRLYDLLTGEDGG